MPEMTDGNLMIGGLAAALRLDQYWGIYAPYAESAVVEMASRLRSGGEHHADAGRMAAIVAAASASVTGTSGRSPEEIAEAVSRAIAISSYSPLHDSRNVADMTGTVRAPMGQNADGTRKPYPVDGGVALLRITGPMTKEETWCMDGTSTVAARRIVRQAKADGDVKAVLIRFYSPGGTVSGNDDLAQDVRALALAKPTYGYCEDLCASAAYYVAAQCNALYANPSALIGSIATIMSHVDYSGMLEKAGIVVDDIVPADAPYKGAGAFGTSLTPDQRAYFQNIVDSFAAQFRGAVKRGRGLSDEQMKKVQDGRVFLAAQARDLGLIDGVTSYDNVLAKLKSYRPPK